MVGIGIRVYSNSRIYFSIIKDDGAVQDYLNISYLNIPLALNIPERLSFIRNTIFDIFTEYQINAAVIRVKEMTANFDQLGIERCNIEGVLIESMADSTITKYEVGTITKLTRILGLAQGDFKKFSINLSTPDNLPDGLDWAKLSKEERESILSCQAALKL